MHSTTRQAFELGDGEIGGAAGAVPDRQVETSRAVIVGSIPSRICHSKMPDLGLRQWIAWLGGQRFREA